MLEFLGKLEQHEIKAKLEKLKGYQDANNKTFMTAKKHAPYKFQQIETVKTSMIQARDGAFSLSQQKLLDVINKNKKSAMS